MSSLGTSRSKQVSRDLAVDTMRGIACVLLVAFHVVGHNPHAGIHVSYDSPYRYFVDSVVYLRMPMFAFLSGVVYAWRPLRESSLYGKYMGKKARRLLISYLFFVPAIGVAQLIVPAANSSTEVPPYLWYVFPLSPYWFLISTFWVFAAVALADSFRLLEKRWVLLSVIVVTFAIDVLTPSPDLTFDTLGLRSALFLLPFFLSGLAATRLEWREARLRWKLLVGGVAIVSVFATQLSLHGVISAIPGRHHPVGIAAGLSLCLLLLAIGWKSKWLSWIGAYSSGIFLFHPFTVAGMRAILQVAGVSDKNILFVSCLLSGVFLSILAVVLFRKFWFGRLVLGEGARR